MSQDSVDNLLIQWAEERPGLALGSLGVAIRIGRLAALLDDHADRALGRLGLSLWEYDVLSALRRQGPPFELSASRLARATRMSSGAITNRVDRLVDQDLVSRERDPTDRRAVIVRLSASGRKLIGDAIEARVRAADDSLDALDEADRDGLATLLRLLLASAERDNGDDAASWPAISSRT